MQKRTSFHLSEPLCRIFSRPSESPSLNNKLRCESGCVRKLKLGNDGVTKLHRDTATKFYVVSPSTIELEPVIESNMRARTWMSGVSRDDATFLPSWWPTRTYACSGSTYLNLVS
jgi:hypothetical protein